MYFEEASVGQIFESPSRTVRPKDLQQFASLTGDRNPLHLDEAFARTTSFGRPVAHGMLTLSMALGLWVELGLTKDSLVALVELDQVRFLRPVFPGDTVRLVTKIVDVRPSRSRPETGLVTYEDRVLNNSQESVLEFRRTVSLKRRPTLAAPEEKGHDGRNRV